MSGARRCEVPLVDSAGVTRSRQIEDFHGRVFGRLTVEALAAKRPSDNCARWVCRCKCGRVVEVRSACLVDGQETCGAHHAWHLRKQRDEKRKQGLCRDQGSPSVLSSGGSA